MSIVDRLCSIFTMCDIIPWHQSICSIVYAHIISHFYMFSFARYKPFTFYAIILHISIYRMANAHIWTYLICIKYNSVYWFWQCLYHTISLNTQLTAEQTIFAQICICNLFSCQCIFGAGPVLIFFFEFVFRFSWYVLYE